MAERKHGGTWPYRSFTVRYHRLAGPDTVMIRADAPWWAEILDAPDIPPITGATYAVVQAAAEQAIDALLAVGGRAAPVSRPKTLRGRYHRITAYLATCPITEHTVVLSFTELEDLLGRPPPKTARTVGPYWTTAGRGLSQGWKTAGWEASLRSDDQVVVFTRRSILSEE